MARGGAKGNAAQTELLAASGEEAEAPKKKGPKKGSAPIEGLLELTWTLAELPSSQHRAGLAGLVQMIRWLHRQPAVPEPWRCEVVAVDAAGATVRMDQRGLQLLFDQVYGADFFEVRTRSRWAGVEPLREEAQETLNAETGKTSRQTFFVYETVFPRGAFLTDFDPTCADGRDGIWVKLWRDMVWNTMRGIPAQRLPFNRRAEAARAGTAPYTADADAAWVELHTKREAQTDLPGTFYLGAQSATAENVPFQDRVRFQFLLHFWPFIAQIYTPTLLDREGKTEFVGYALAIPDVADLEAFGEEFEPVMRRRAPELWGYRPREAVIDLPIESALRWLDALRELLASREQERSFSDLLLGVDVIHVQKNGNTIDLLNITRLEPEGALVERYRAIRRAYWSPLFRAKRLQNLITGARWFTGFDALCMTSPFAQIIDHPGFRHDARLAFDPKMEDHLMPAPPKKATSGEPTSLEELVYRVVRTYVQTRVERKYGVSFDAAKGNKQAEDDFNTHTEKVAREAFLAVRARTDGMDFVAYFTSTLCSVPQYLGEEGFRSLSRELSADPEQLRTLTLLALSANATPPFFRKSKDTPTDTKE